eukprot:COSAG01_NODE_7266_length_3276_cov_2.619767_3_plen_179_part_00
MPPALRLSGQTCTRCLSDTRQTATQQRQHSASAQVATPAHRRTAAPADLAIPIAPLAISPDDACIAGAGWPAPVVEGDNTGLGPWLPAPPDDDDRSARPASTGSAPGAHARTCSGAPVGRCRAGKTGTAESPWSHSVAAADTWVIRLGRRRHHRHRRHALWGSVERSSCVASAISLSV